jgi:gliding motility-associated-like protein
MSKVLHFCSRILATILLLLSCFGAQANHLVGMDLFYTWVSGNTYRITLIAYADCGSASTTSAFAALPTNTPEIYIYNGNSYISTINLSIQPPSGGVEITPVCPADISNTQCTNPSFTIPGIKKFVYAANYTVSGPSPVWRFLFTGQLGGSIAGRAVSITNISSTPLTYTQLVDTLNNVPAPNSNPVLTNVPTPFFCLSSDNNYNPGAVDPNADNLEFALVPGANGSATSAPGGSVGYIAPYSGTNPLAVSTMSFDPLTGQISFNPSALQRSLVVYNIREFRAGVFVGSCQREMTFLVQTCTNPPPVGSLTSATGGTLTDATHFRACQNSGPFSMHIYPTASSPGYNITVSAAGLPTGLSFTTTGNGTPAPHSTISWTSTGVAPGNYTFYVTYTDNGCPLSGTQTIAYTITILPQPTVSYSLISAATCTKKAAISIVPGSGGAPWTVKVSKAASPFDTIQTFPGITGTFTDSLAPGNYVITLFTSGAGCKASVTVTLAIPSIAPPTTSFVNPTYCGAIDGKIILGGLAAGNYDTVRFYYNGIAQPPQNLLVAADGTITINGLRAGTYSLITVQFGRYCVSSPVGPVILVNPPFNMRALTSVNPEYCGICNGSIKLWGLRPGQLDTITYTKDGFSQTPVSWMIGPDSTVTLTGLCHGVYANFVAHTAGVCVSNVLGPETLTVPPFTMRALTFTNPDFCGICNGTIKIWGLHPGQLDTIAFTKDGLAQPPVSAMIGPDSTLTLTGLCAGVYANFVARTAGVCVSNVLGPVTLSVPPFTMRTITSTNPDYCGICNGTIKLWGLHPGQTDTITYTKGGVLQTPIVATIGIDSTVTLTGLCAGVYDNFVAHTGGVCVSNTLGPVTLTVPPFTMRTLTSTNPDYCGVCNGTIKIWGLHPGQTDTITFRKDGIAQTPVVALIPWDSTVTLTGLCAGVYDNFVARTGGVCVSNTLGPVTLTVPPFTVRALTFTNPDYCGICNGTIKIWGLHPGQTDTISYTLNGSPMAPIVTVVPTDSALNMTGLCAGVYDNFVARTGGVCVSNTLGPANLVVPPFTMDRIEFVHPSKCGFCDGRVLLRGLHPGQTDTITFTKDGIPQPPVSYYVGTDSTVIISGLCKGTYANFVARTGGVCVSNTLGPVTLVDPPIAAGFTFVVHENCSGDSVFFTNTSTPPADLTYTWSFGDGGSISTLTNPVHIYTLPGTFTIKLHITNTACVDSSIQSIAITNLVKAGFTSNPDSFLCTGKPVTFTNTSLGTSMKYLWTFGDGTTDTATNPVHTFEHTGVYYVKMVVTNYVPCKDSMSKRLEVDSISAVSIETTDSVFCGGHGATFTGLYSKQGNTGIRWTFDSAGYIDNVNPVMHAFDQWGTLTIKFEAFYRACPDTTATRSVLVIPYPTVDLGPDTTICPGSAALVLRDARNEKKSNARWRWNTGETTPSIVVVAPGTYYTNVNVGGCQSSDSVIVEEDCYLAIPNVFTPNGDGLNDYFFPRELLSRGLSSFKMDVFNRWGQEVFSTTSTEGRGWDGTFNGVPQGQGVFVYRIDATFKDGQMEHHQGNVTLLR